MTYRVAVEAGVVNPRLLKGRVQSPTGVWGRAEPWSPSYPTIIHVCTVVVEKGGIARGISPCGQPVLVAPAPWGFRHVLDTCSRCLQAMSACSGRR